MVGKYNIFENTKLISKKIKESARFINERVNIRFDASISGRLKNPPDANIDFNSKRLDF